MTYTWVDNEENKLMTFSKHLPVRQIFTSANSVSSAACSSKGKGSKLPWERSCDTELTFKLRNWTVSQSCTLHREGHRSIVPQDPVLKEVKKHFKKTIYVHNSEIRVNSK